MINRRVLAKDQVMSAMKNKEFGNDVIGSKERVVVILTQDWCPQWLNLKSWVYDLMIDEEIDVYELIYNKTDYFYDFKNFKETKWRNFEIPYLRFYRSGKLIRESNFVSMQEFKSILGILKKQENEKPADI